MERSTPVRKPHTSTADLLSWPETPLMVDPPVADSATRHSHKPSGGISHALFGGPMTEEEAESVNKRFCPDPVVDPLYVGIREKPEVLAFSFNICMT